MKLLNEISGRRRYRIRVRLVIILLAALAVYWFSLLIQENHYLLALVPTLLLAVLSAIEFALADIVLDHRFPPESLEFLERLEDRSAKTTVQQEIVGALQSCVASFSGCDVSRISSTVHLRVDVRSEHDSQDQPALVQISDYTKKGLGGRRWRTLSTTKGLVGRCFRLNEEVTANFRDRADYLVGMVRDFGFSRDEAERHTSTARSYMAFPLRNNDELVGIIYFFSTEPQVFPLAANGAAVSNAQGAILSLLRTAGILAA